MALGSRYYYAEMEYDKHHYPNDSIKSLLNDLAIERNIDVQVVGFHGRKGPKQDPTVMGSAVMFLSVNTAAPILIVKDPIDRSTKANGAYSHALCSDGSR